jgi:hypothetical protein
MEPWTNNYIPHLLPLPKDILIPQEAKRSGEGGFRPLMFSPRPRGKRCWIFGQNMTGNVEFTFTGMRVSRSASPRGRYWTKMEFLYREPAPGKASFLYPFGKTDRQAPFTFFGSATCN